MMISKLTAVVLVTFALVGAFPAAVSTVPTAMAQNIPTPEDLLPDFFDDEEDENGNDDDNGDEDSGDGGGDEQGDDNQNIEQTIEQEQEAEQEVEQEVDQSEENEQSNTLETGDNAATVTQANAAEQAVEAAAAAESGDAEAEDEDDGKYKKHHYSGSSDSDSTTADANSIATANAEATGLIDQDNNADVNQDSSADDNILVNENEFGDDTNIQVAVPIVDQDQTAANLATNLDLNIIEEEVPPAEEVPPEPEETFEVCVDFGFAVGLVTLELTQEQIDELEEEGFVVTPGPCILT